MRDLVTISRRLELIENHELYDLRTLVLKTVSLFKLFNLDSDNRPLILAVSGGPDSMAMLYLMVQLRSEGSLKRDLKVVHINHLIRREAFSDAKLVKETCTELGIDFIYREVNVPELHRKVGGSLEEVARRARYRALQEERERLDASHILVAHTRDDFITTLLMNLIRGAGPTGLRGMPIRSGYIVRPLILADKGKLMKYLQENSIRYAVDKTNFDLKFFRNRIYHDLLPKLRGLRNGLDRQLAKTALLQAELLEAVRNLADIKISLYPKSYFIPEGEIVRLTALEPRLLIFALAEILRRIPRKQKLELSDLVNLLSIFDRGRAKVTVTTDWYAQFSSGTAGDFNGLALYQSPPQLHPIRFKVYDKVELTLTHWGVHLYISSNEGISEDIHKSGAVEVIRVPEGLEVELRTWRYGDRLIGSEKKLKALLYELKLPVWLRERYPVLALPDSNQVIYFPRLNVLKRGKLVKLVEKVLREFNIQQGPRILGLKLELRWPIK